MVKQPLSINVARMRKLNWQTRGFYTPGSRVRCSPHPKEFDYETGLLAVAAESKAFRIHADLLSGDLAIAACSALFSSDEMRAWMRMPRSFDFGTFGLPILVLIKILCV